MIELLDELSVCNDCLIWIANNDDSALDLQSGAVAEAYREARDIGLDRIQTNGSNLVADGEELGFSMNPCPICSGLAGDRYKVALLSR